MKSSMRGFPLPGRRALYLPMLAMLFMTAAGFYLLAPSTTTVVEAQKGSRDLITSDSDPRPDRLAIALDFRSAHNMAVYGGDSLNLGNSEVRGERPEAATKDQAGLDLARAHNIINQLDCTRIEDGDLTGKVVGPGVYCLNSVRLGGQLTLDGIGDPQATFVFRVKGDVNAEPGSGIATQNGALPQNVYFVADGKASVADGVTFNGTILARGDITLGAGSDVKGRTWSLTGKVDSNGAESAAGGGTGILEICKFVPANEILTGTGNLSNRVFRFRIGAAIYETPVGQCTGPIDLAVGNVLIEELLDGRTLPTGTFNGRFRLLDVNSPTPGALGAVNLSARTANVFIREGGINNMTVVNFVNTFAIPVVIEICKRAVAGDPGDVTGFFDFNVDAVPNTTFSVPVGFCSGPIQVLVVTAPGPVPQDGIVRVTELARAGFQLDSTSTFPGGRQLGEVLNFRIPNTAACSTIGDGPVPASCLASNPGGGFVSAIVFEGGAEIQTTFNFFNRARPGRVKICKIAGPGIPEGTIFRFRVRGTGPSNAFPGPQLPGVAIDTTVDVAAGPAAQGGFCNFVDASFIIGTLITVNELGNITPITGVPPGIVMVSRIRFQGQVAGFSQAQLQQLSPPPSANGPPTGGVGVLTVARTEVIEFEYTNFVFRPTVLKICKIAGTGVPVGTLFTFSIRIDDVGGLFAPPSSIAVPNLTVAAGPASSGGYCAFAQGPYMSTLTNPPVGTFRVGSTVYVTEAAAAGTVISSIGSPTGTVIPCVPADPRCGGLVLGFPGGVNEIAFTNSAGSVASESAPFDFDGDGKTDVSVTRMGGSSTWYQLVGTAHNYVQFDLGQTGDIVVPADYDGDGKTQPGVFRPSTGDWWVMDDGESVSVAVNAGAVGDIPLPSDYTGDGKADFVLFRPSTSQWLRYANGSTATSHMSFGTTGDKPLMADFDGDGKADPAVFRPSTGTFWYASSAQGNSFRAVQWGTAGDIPVAADFDGDGMTDFAIFRPSNGEWWIRRSTDGGLTGAQWGGNGDRPLTGDWDGDGKADLAVFRPSNGTWYIVKSGGGFQGYQWGISSDIPSPSAYVP